MEIVYYFGAGASCESLPLINNIPERLNEFYQFLTSNKIQSSEIFDDRFSQLLTSPGEMLNELEQDLKWIIDESHNHSTIDTFAKKLFITSDSKTRNLKAALSCFFLFQQALYGIDHRYDTFFASIIDYSGTNIQLPKNIRVISWNYDSQFEMAISKYLPGYPIDSIRDKLNSIPIPGHKIDIKNDEFSLVRLNGIAGAFENKGVIYRASDTALLTKQDYFATTISNESKKTYKEIILNYAFNKKDDCYSYLNFSWEDNTLTESILASLNAVNINAEILIVVGYSFPFFNRRIDRRIIQNMRNLKKIYMQFPDSFVNNSIIRIKALMNSNQSIEIIPITDINEFYIPHEYD